jgi:short subunit dehydrogenase-like uncharacterized protein
MADNAIWILGATGRIGRAVATRLATDGHLIVLVGRDAARLTKLATQIRGDTTTEVAGTLSGIADKIARQRPAIVVNTIGPFTRTALPLVGACPPGTHYVDLSNELPSVEAILALHDQAVSAGSTYVTGAGFGVLGTESVVLTLCDGQPAARRVRCAAIPAAAVEAGPLGEAFAASITEGMGSGGRRYEAGRLVRAPLLGAFERVRLPDGRMMGTASGPSGELEAAQRASGAPDAIAATSMVPSAPILRAALPALLSVMKIGPVRRFVARRIAAIEVKPSAKPSPQVSWSYARVEWSSGSVRQGWMRTGDAMVFTAEVLAQVVTRLAKGECKPGSYTPGALFGPKLAVACGGEVMIDAG